MLLFIITTTSTSSGYARFNTSHVTLYPMLIVGCNTIIGFQYISCYSLSNGFIVAYIFPIRFNTSHVTLYPCNTSSTSTSSKRFNTSHVTLYLVQITNQFLLSSFQYISCYSLSTQKDRNNNCNTSVSIHLMLLFISGQYRAMIIPLFVSIHLMLLFISR